MSTKYVKLYFRKAPPKTGYFSNSVEDVPEDMAKEYIKAGYARQATQTLPNDIPGRKALIEAGYESVEDVKEIESPESINGIGAKTAKDLAEYLAK